MVVELVAVVALIGANFFFVASEFAFTRARPSMVADLAAQGVRGSESLRKAVERIDAYLSATQLGITLASIGLGFVAEPAFAWLLGPVLDPAADAIGIDSHILSFIVAYAVASVLHVAIGELAAKSLAIARTRSTALALALPMRVFYVTSKPAVDAMNWLGGLVLRPFGIPPVSEAPAEPHSEEELRWIMRESREAGVLDADEERIADNVFSFGDRRAREAMIPRPDVKYLTSDMDVDRAAQTMLECGRHRMPLADVDGGLDETAGVVHTQDLLRAYRSGDEIALADIARPLLRVPDATLLDELMQQMREQQKLIALVVDEHGTMVGLITLEDVLEQIVGDIRDETDAGPERRFENEADGVRATGGANLRDLRSALGSDDEEGLLREATLGGYLAEQLGRAPRVGDEIDIAGRTARVVSDGDLVDIEVRIEERSPDAGNDGDDAITPPE